MAIQLESTSERDLRIVVEQMTSGKPLDREAAKKALADLSKEREELRKRIGTINVAVDLVREARDHG